MRIEASDIATTPNAISAAGFGLVIAGVHEGMDTPLGTGLVVAGRMMDVLDGYEARRTGQTSEFGARLDASLDKLGMLAIVTHLAHKDIIPSWVATGITAQNTANTIATFAAQSKHPERTQRPEPIGKLAMAVQGAALASYTMGALLKERAPRVAKASRLAGHMLAGAGIVRYGLPATRKYLSRI